MDVPVMDYVAAIKQGDFQKAAALSFDCIQCGLCATRCMAEMAQYHIAQMVRRINGSKITPRAQHLVKMVSDIDAGKYTEGLAVLKAMDTDTLKKTYMAREMEPHMSPEDWKPKSDAYL